MSALGLQPRGGKLYQAGESWRGIGCNHFALFLRELFTFGGGSVNTGLENDLQDLSGRGIPFVRFAAGWFDYVRWRDDYAINPDRYWSTLDRVVAAAARYEVGLVPCMFWTLRAFADLSHHYGSWQSLEQMSVRNSVHNVRFAEFTQTFVRRYAGSPAILGWEFCNEGLSNAGPEFFPAWALDGSFQPWLDWGLRPDGTAYPANAKLSMAGYRRLLAQWASICRANDPHARFLSAGNAIGNSFATMAWNVNTLTAASRADYLGKAETEGVPYMNWANQDVDVLSMHFYPVLGKVGDSIYFGDGDRTVQQHFDDVRAWADQSRKPLAMLEFGASYLEIDGVDGVSVDVATEQANFATLLTLMRERADISAVWNYGGNMGSSGWMQWDVTVPARRYQLDAIAAANRDLRK